MYNASRTFFRMVHEWYSAVVDFVALPPQRPKSLRNVTVKALQRLRWEQTDSLKRHPMPFGRLHPGRRI